MLQVEHPSRHPTTMKK